ncbi:hypothetical protein E2C01_064528 [Portunus trituberculatus]|uniref:Uncharacterized protein n=1 Tax=Portunus trituberculatus TaxID=210409 RepID=A0A5B7HP07_PORTR|nr:hypothetical protein [Portunus trituberculatus]
MGVGESEDEGGAGRVRAREGSGGNLTGMASFYEARPTVAIVHRPASPRLAPPRLLSQPAPSQPCRP